MKAIITAVMAGMMAMAMSGCAALMPQAAMRLSLAMAGINVNGPKPKAAPVKDDSHVYAKALVKLGDAEYAGKKFKNALGHYDDALREWDNDMIYTKIAYCLRNLGNIADAKMVYKKALKMAALKKGGM